MYQRRRTSFVGREIGHPALQEPPHRSAPRSRTRARNATGWDADAMAESIAWVPSLRPSDASSSGTARSSQVHLDPCNPRTARLAPRIFMGMWGGISRVKLAQAPKQ